MPVASCGIDYPGNRIHAPNENIRRDYFRMGVLHTAELIEAMGKSAGMTDVKLATAERERRATAQPNCYLAGPARHRCERSRPPERWRRAAIYAPMLRYHLGWQNGETTLHAR